jgi:hypothetical protein
MADLHDLPEAVLDVGGEGGGDIGGEGGDADALRDHLDRLLGNDAHPALLLAPPVPVNPSLARIPREQAPGEEAGHRREAEVGTGGRRRGRWFVGLAAGALVGRLVGDGDGDWLGQEGGGGERVGSGAGERVNPGC